MSGIGDRLREERDRLGLSQAAFGEIGGVKANAQGNYEKGERFPDAGYLAAVAAVGVDVLYVVIGERKPRAADSIAAEEAELLDHYRQLPTEDRAGVTKIVTAMSAMAGNYQVGKR
jgi:transcriptional regulator with XRE-family HTH domain